MNTWGQPNNHPICVLSMCLTHIRLPPSFQFKLKKLQTNRQLEPHVWLVPGRQQQPTASSSEHRVVWGYGLLLQGRSSHLQFLPLPSWVSEPGHSQSPVEAPPQEAVGSAAAHPGWRGSSPPTDTWGTRRDKRKTISHQERTYRRRLERSEFLNCMFNPAIREQKVNLLRVVSKWPTL